MENHGKPNYNGDTDKNIRKWRVQLWSESKRNERLGVIARVLADTPNRIHTLGSFCEMFAAAKSTVSEDIDLVDEALRRFDLGRLETVAGAAGGVRFLPVVSRERARARLMGLCQRLGRAGQDAAGRFCTPQM